MKSKLKFLLISFFFVTGVIVYSSFYCKYYSESKDQNSMVAIFVEENKINEKGEKQYVLAEGQVLNDDNYLINEELSTCQNGEKIVYDKNTNTYSVNVYGQDKCDIYLDKKDTSVKENEPVTPNSFTEEENTKETTTEEQPNNTDVNNIIND